MSLRRGNSMKPTKKICATLTVVGVIVLVCLAYAQQEQRGQTSYMPVDIKETFASIMARMTKAKPAIEKEHTSLLNQRYDLANRASQGTTMSLQQPEQGGARVQRPARR